MLDRRSHYELDNEPQFDKYDILLKEIFLLQPIPRHETPNLVLNFEMESRFRQLLYNGQTLVVQKLTESKFGIPKFGIPIEIWSLMSAE